MKTVKLRNCFTALCLCSACTLPELCLHWLHCMHTAQRMRIGGDRERPVQDQPVAYATAAAPPPPQCLALVFHYSGPGVEFIRERKRVGDRPECVMTHCHDAPSRMSSAEGKHPIHPSANERIRTARKALKCGAELRLLITARTLSEFEIGMNLTTFIHSLFMRCLCAVGYKGA